MYKMRLEEVFVKQEENQWILKKDGYQSNL